MKTLVGIGMALAATIVGYVIEHDAPQDRIEKLEKRIESLSEELKQRRDDVNRLDTEIIPSLKQQILAAKAEQSKAAGALRTSLDVGLLRAIPIGTIVSWSGGLDSLPDTWAVCDGRTVNGIKTPDLRSHFLRGAGTNPDSVAGVTGGTDTIPSHFHLIEKCQAYNIKSGSILYPSIGFRGYLLSEKEINFKKFNELPSITDAVQYLPTLLHQHTDGAGDVKGVTEREGAGDNRPAYYSVHFIMRVK